MGPNMTQTHWLLWRLIADEWKHETDCKVSQNESLFRISTDYNNYRVFFIECHTREINLFQ